MKTIALDLPESASVFAIGANGDYLRHFAREFIREGGSPDRLIVIRDASLCPEAVCGDMHGVSEHAIHVSDLAVTIRALGPPTGALGCVFAWHRVISAEIIDAFAGRLFNLHHGDLPRYRGAGGGSWQVLNGEMQITSFVHGMTEDLDRGAVLVQETELFGTDEPYPRHVKQAAHRASLRVITRLVRLVTSGGAVQAVAQDEDAALYFPRLHTSHNGWIDFSWPADDILRFVRAFSDPYSGASFRYRNARFRVRRATLRNRDALHPFCIGLIVNRTTDGVHVAAKDGVLLFSNICTADGTDCTPDTFKVGGRLWTGPKDLVAALRFRPSAIAVP